MSRYLTFLAWAIAFSAGAYAGGVPFDVAARGLCTFMWGCIATNWAYGTHNPTGFAVFNPVEKDGETE